MPITTLGKWGNATAVRIPLAICEELGFEPGKTVVMDVVDSQLIIRNTEHGYTLAGRMAAWDGEYYRGEEIDWGEPEGQEIW